jgi:phage tail sheath protein FI
LSIPGIRDENVTNFALDEVKRYGKAIYLIDIPSYDDNSVRLFDDSAEISSVRKTISKLEARVLDNNYAAAYFPDIIKRYDQIDGGIVTVPASIAAIEALGYNDSISFPWFAPAGFNRGGLSDILNTKLRLNTEDRNLLYEARINPIANFNLNDFVIFGQKTLQQSRSALDRVNVRRMLLEVKRIVSDAAVNIIFEQNVKTTRDGFIASVTPQLALIQSQQGIEQFRVIMNDTNNTQEDIEQNRLNGRIVLVPTRAVEFIALDFIITNSGVSFE